SGSYDGSIILWNMTNGQKISMLSKEPEDAILSVGIYDKEIISGDQGNNIEFWNIDEMKANKPPIYLSSWVRTVDIHPSGFFIAAGLEDSQIVIIDRSSSMVVKNFTSHTRSIRSVDFHPTKQLLASASGDSTVRVWNITDLDQDNLPDIWEISNGLSPTNSLDGQYDSDADGLTNINEYYFGTNPKDDDTDDDGINDGYEYRNGLNGTIDDSNLDKDGDGIPNLYEYQNGLNISVDDTQDDSDGDGMPNIFEYANGLLAGVDDAYGDLDNDGMPNIFEYIFGLRITEDDAKEDPDNDGLSNFQEFILGTNPKDFDTDNDGFNDGLEKSLGTSPTIFVFNPFTVVIFIALLFVSLIGSVNLVYQKRNHIRTFFISNRKLKQHIKDLKEGKALSIKSLAETIGVSEIDVIRRLKSELMIRNQYFSHKDKSIVLRSDMLLIVRVPPKNASCQICMTEIVDNNYFQCEKCKRFVCIHDFLDLKTIGKESCPNCGGKLIIFPFSCPACGVDFSSVSELEHKKGCPLCGYQLPDQTKLVTKLLSELNPSDFAKGLVNEHNSSVTKSTAKPGSDS
ncbi:MAG: hypothetical protein ACTSW1_15730, partial [Candidatus Hodarchaeales archaeon]